MVMEIRFTFCLLLIVTLGNCSDNDTSIPDEVRLYNYLFKGDRYNKNVRPLLDKTKSVQVSLGLAYVQLVELNIRAQTLKSNVWIRQSWINELLTWDKEEFGGITELTVDKKLLWLPDLVLHNNANPKRNRALVDQALTRIRITHTGLQRWYSPAILYSSCSVDITFFPFDYQSCKLKFGSWTYDLEGLNLSLAKAGADTDFYLPSSEISLLSFVGRRNVNFYQCCPMPFIDVTFYLNLKRLPGFYLYNVIVPSVTITIFALTAFAFPDENSGRTDLVLSCFLSLVILSMMIASSMPVNSDTTPLIGIFMLTSMVQMCLSGFVNVFCVILYKQRGERTPKWLRVLFLEMLGPYFRVKPPPITAELDACEPLTRNLGEYEIETEFNGRGSLQPLMRRNVRTSNGRSRHLMNKRKSLSSRVSRQLLTKRSIDDLGQLVRIEQDRDKEEDRKLFWHTMSKIADRVIFLSLLFSWSASAFFLALKIPKGM